MRTARHCIPIRHEGDDDPRRWYCERCEFTAIDEHGHFPDSIYRACPKAPYGPGDLSEAVDGPGIDLKRIIDSLRLTPAKSCGCDEMISKMNAWGIAGCKKHRAEIVEHLRKAYESTSWSELCAAVARAVTSGLVVKLNPLDPLGSLVDEAIRRAETSRLSASAV